MRHLFASLVLLSLIACKRDAAPAPEPAAQTPVPAAQAPAAQPVFTQGYVVELAPDQTQAEMRAGRWPNLHDKHGRVGAVLTGREYPKRIVRTTGTQHYSLVGYVVWEELTT